MDPLTPLSPLPGPPASDMEEPRTPDPAGTPPLVDLAVQGLAQWLEALPPDLGERSLARPPLAQPVTSDLGLVPQDTPAAPAESGIGDQLDASQGPAEPLLEESPQPPEEAASDRSSGSSPEPWLETVPLVTPERPPAAPREPPPSAPGPCDPEDLLDGVVFGAKYLGSTQLDSERNPPPSTRMAQAQEAVDRVKAPDGETQPTTEVDLFVSTQRVKVLTADTQEALMDHALQTVSFVADIGPLLVLMARGRRRGTQTPHSAGAPRRRLYRMLCHVFQAQDAQLIAQAVGQAFGAAYNQFLRDRGLDPDEAAAMVQGGGAPGPPHNADLDHFCNSDNCREVCVEKRPGEGLGLALVLSGFGALLPTAEVANLHPRGPSARAGLSIGDRITALNGASLVGLPLTACQAALREVRPLTRVTLSIVHCPPVTTAVVRRPHGREQLGFCVEDGVICSLLRGGIAERGGVRVGHRIIEINGQSVVAVPHERVIQLLTEAHTEVHIKTMPDATYRLLTGQEQPVFL